MKCKLVITSGILLAAVVLLCIARRPAKIVEPEINLEQIYSLMPGVKWEKRGSAMTATTEAGPRMAAYDIATLDLPDYATRLAFVNLVRDYLKKNVIESDCRVLGDFDFVPDAAKCDGGTILFSAGDSVGMLAVIAFAGSTNEYWVRVESILAKR